MCAFPHLARIFKHGKTLPRAQISAIIAEIRTRNHMASNLPTYLLELQSRGQVLFASEEAEQALQLGHGAFLDAAERLQKQNQLIRLRRNLYAIVPPQFRSWGAPPPSWYIDALMRHEASTYYVGLLKAAELHGATHQAVLEYQVVAQKRIRKRTVGRSKVNFFYRRDIEAVSSGIISHKSETGPIYLSSVELTALDLLRYPHASAGLDNVATVLADLGTKINEQALARLSPAFKTPVVQRLGHLLDQLGFDKSTRLMHRKLTTDELPPWTELEPESVADRELIPPTIERDRRWNVVVRRRPEVDE